MKNKLALVFIAILCLFSGANAQLPAKTDSVLPGTKPLTWHTNLADTMMAGAHQFIARKIDEAIANRSELWDRDFSSKDAYIKSIKQNRNRFMKYIGIKEKSNPFIEHSIGIHYNPPSIKMQKFSDNNDSVLVAETAKYRVYQVRWPVLDGVYGEGLLLQPKTNPKANVIAIPDADQTPEQLVGLSPGISAKSQFARRLAENGFQVLVPVLISRQHFTTDGGAQQTYREWIYRQAFHMGRHIIGFEVEKIMSAIDWFKKTYGKDSKIGVAGYGEGGLIAFYSAAVDQRIDAVSVSGYFNSRKRVWEEPIYRNVWGLLGEFGDAEIASLIAPRSLVVERSAIPSAVEKTTAKPPHLDMSTYTGYKGSLKTPPYKDVKSEFNRIGKLIKPGFQSHSLFAGNPNKPVQFGSKKALEKFARNLLGHNMSLPISDTIPADNRSSFNPEDRQLRQVKELEDHVQRLMLVSDQVRNNFFLYKVMSPEFGGRTWSTKRYNRYSEPDQFIKKAKDYRRYFWEKVLGKFEDRMLSPNARTKKVYDKPRWTGYQVVLDVYNDLIAPGIILIPKDIKPGEKRPVVVVQHGRDSSPEHTIEGKYAYYQASAKLADQGFIVFAPYGLFRGKDQYRWLDRKANTIKKTLFSFVTAQHQQILKWLGTLPFVDSKRIGLYGLSFGGETALRVPAVLKGYSLSISSGFFSDETHKVVTTHNWRSFMNTKEWEIPYFNMGNTFSHAEMAYLIFPRPFMDERGHFDTVAPDRWVGYEYAKVRHLYDQFGLGERTKIQFFNGGHAMHNSQTFEFLHKYLKWP